MTDRFDGIWRLWPGLVVIFGSGFILLHFQRGKTDPVLMWLGSFCVLCGMFFFYLNFSPSSWVQLKDKWPIFLGIVGTSFLANHLTRPSKVFFYLALSFITVFVVIFLVFSISPKLWPASFVVFGASLIIINYYNHRT